ncbi:MAG: universal stress protein [Candidatus Rokubacteria bacterium]|nr:universal stress protein [Candidatus Rokubacteria bacterium]
MKARRVLHPSDFSTVSNAAFGKAVEVAKDDGAELLVVHVLAPIGPLVGDGYVSPRTFEDLERAAHEQAQKRLGALVARAKKAGVRASSMLAEGVPWQEVVRIVKSKRIDLVVMGTHGRSGLAKFFLGSVAERVVASSPCPVLTVRSR